MTKVMLVEDEAAQRDLYREVLEEAGFVVVPAATGMEALTLFRTTHPDIVVLDIQMPGIDGIDALARLLAIDRGIPVILHSAYPVHKGNFLTWAADAYVVKRGNPQDLVREVCRLALERGIPVPQGKDEAVVGK